MRKAFIYGCLPTLLFLSACGYKVPQSTLYKEGKSIGIPYVKGDLDGSLTSLIIQSISRSTDLSYKEVAAEILLKAEIVKKEFSTIGYQYDIRESNEELINRLVPNEGSWLVELKVSLFDQELGKTIFGPYELQATCDCDFVNFDNFRDLSFQDNSSQTQSVLQFSLGQLDARAGAKEAALQVVYTRLAEKVALGLQNL